MDRGASPRAPDNFDVFVMWFQKIQNYGEEFQAGDVAHLVLVPRTPLLAASLLVSMSLEAVGPSVQGFLSCHGSVGP